MKSIGNSNFDLEAALKELSSLVLPSEKVLKILPCFYNAHYGILVATTEKILFVGGSDLKGAVFKIPYEKLLNVSLQPCKGDRGKIVIQTIKEGIIVTDCDVTLANDLIDAIEKLIDNDVNFYN